MIIMIVSIHIMQGKGKNVSWFFCEKKKICVFLADMKSQNFADCVVVVVWMFVPISLRYLVEFQKYQNNKNAYYVPP